MKTKKRKPLGARATFAKDPKALEAFGDAPQQQQNTPADNSDLLAFARGIGRQERLIAATRALVDARACLAEYYAHFNPHDDNGGLTREGAELLIVRTQNAISEIELENAQEALLLLHAQLNAEKQRRGIV
jgi:hypothetical protein